MPKNISQFNNIHIEHLIEFVHLFFQLTFSKKDFLSIRFLTGLICIASGAIKMSGTHRQHKASLLNGKSPGDSSSIDYCPLLLGIMVQRKCRQKSKWCSILPFWSRGKTQRGIDIGRRTAGCIPELPVRLCFLSSECTRRQTW